MKAAVPADALASDIVPDRGVGRRVGAAASRSCGSELEVARAVLETGAAPLGGTAT